MIQIKFSMRPYIKKTGQKRIGYVKSNPLQAIKTVLLLVVSIFFCIFATDKILLLSRRI